MGRRTRLSVTSPQPGGACERSARTVTGAAPQRPSFQSTVPGRPGQRASRRRTRPVGRTGGPPIDGQRRDEFRPRRGFPEHPPIDPRRRLRRRESRRQGGRAEPGLVLCRQSGDPRPESLEHRFLAGPAPKERQRLDPASAIAANAACSAAVKNDATIRSASVIGRIRSMSTPTSRPRQTAMIARSAECETLNRSAGRRSPGPSIEFRLAHRGGPEPQRVGRLVQQSAQDLAECRPAAGEPPPFACPHEPRGPRPFVLREHRQLRARLGGIRHRRA